ncbi:hypothetical protein [Streptomyces sp. MI02-7b]|uniref:hypothetical protein n=1 Tax=Streptomyces sp. MI02-7b TaxID=462941 RepID=UPI0029A88BD4|nr:hypothetical protein [Streptomyces sp. MI02-7b]MDX3074577.1 hypothetical protein [Streptomyces sp. MI02-7b]
MTTRDTETLAQLIAERAGKRGSGLPTFEQLSDRSKDPESDYRPAASLLWKIAQGQDVKINPPLIRAIAEGLSLPRRRVQEAAARQFLGWQVDDPFGTPSGGDDKVVRVARRPGVTARDLPRVEDQVEGSDERNSGE